MNNICRIYYFDEVQLHKTMSTMEIHNWHHIEMMITSTFLVLKRGKKEELELALS